MDNNPNCIELQRLNSRSNPRDLFNKYDRNRNGTIDLNELKEIIKAPGYDRDIPEHVVKQIFRKADKNRDGQLSFIEFQNMLADPDNNFAFSAIKKRYFQYVNLVVCKRKKPATDVDGVYEEEYTCCPPAVFMIIVSLVEIVLFLIDIWMGHESTQATGAVATALLYDPHRRKEVWRFLSYMFVHIGYFHLVVNILVQILLGVPLEMVHRGWRVLIIYFAGVLCGSLGTSLTDPSVKLAGASGGVYSLITAHLATIMMNWSEMSYPFVQLLIYLILIICDVGTAVYNRYILNLDQSIGYAAHFCGALAGLLVGITVLRNIDVKTHEKVLQWIALIIFVLLIGAAIVINIFHPDYFPPQYV